MRRIESSEAAGPGDVLALSVQHSWIATRYALPRARRGYQHALDSKVGHPRDQRWFRLEVTMEVLGDLLGLLASEGIEYEVWR